MNWILTVLVYGSVSTIAINAFSPTVVATSGKDHITALLLTAPPYLLECVTYAAVSWHAEDRTNERYQHTVTPLATALAGSIISCAATGIGPRYFGAMIMLPGIYTSFNMRVV